jgi:hypothetical protein
MAQNAHPSAKAPKKTMVRVTLPATPQHAYGEQLNLGNLPPKVGAEAMRVTQSVSHQKRVSSEAEAE